MESGKCKMVIGCRQKAIDREAHPFEISCYFVSFRDYSCRVAVNLAASHKKRATPRGHPFSLVYLIRMLFQSDKVHVSDVIRNANRA